MPMRWLPRLALALTALLVLPAAAIGQGTRPPVKIGLLLPYTGVIAVNGQETTRGIEFFLSKIGNKAGGREIQLLKEDDEAKPDVGQTKIRKLVERDKVDVLVGPVHSGVALAIRDYVHAQGIPLIVPVAFTRDLTAPAKASPWIFRVVETSDQGNFPMGTWVFKKTPYRKMVVIASDFVAGRHSAEAFTAAFKAAGGEVVKEIYAPLNTPDFAPYIAQVAALPADAVYAWFAGADSIRFVRAYKEYGLAGKLPLLAYNTLVDDVLLRSEEHTSELQSRLHLVCRLLLEKKKNNDVTTNYYIDFMFEEMQTLVDSFPQSIPDLTFLVLTTFDLCGQRNSDYALDNLLDQYC